MPRSLRFALLIVLAIAGCGGPNGTPRPACELGALAGVEAVAAKPLPNAAGATEAAISIDCWRLEPAARERRIALAFTLPEGSACQQLVRVELSESAETVAVALIAAATRAAGGECPGASEQLLTVVELQAPLDDRRVLEAPPSRASAP